MNESRSLAKKVFVPVALLAAGLLLLVVLSLRIGTLPVSTDDAVGALFSYDEDSYPQQVIRSLRLPRTLLGLAVGAALGVSGAVIQGISRNPLGDPGILGINSGAALAIVVALSVFGITSPGAYVWIGFLGSLAAAVLVIGLGSAGQRDLSGPRLVLAGFVTSTLLSAWMTAVLLLDAQTLDLVRFWLAGSLAGRDPLSLVQVAPFLVLGTGALLFSGTALNILQLGEDSARSLGMNTALVRTILGIGVVLASGAAVAAAGPISFVGLAVPHLVRALTGTDYRRILPLAALAGPIVLLASDIVGRLVVRPSELQVGIVTAVLGAPVLIALLLGKDRRRRAAVATSAGVATGAESTADAGPATGAEPATSAGTAPRAGVATGADAMPGSEPTSGADAAAGTDAGAAMRADAATGADKSSAKGPTI